MSTLVWQARRLRFWLWRTLYPRQYAEHRASMAALAASVKAFKSRTETLFSPSANVARQFSAGFIEAADSMDWYTDIDTTMAQNFHKRPFTERLERWLRDW